MEKHGAVRLNAAQLERLTKAAFTFKEGHGGGCPEPVVNKEFIGKDAAVLAKAAGVNVPDKTQLLFAETDEDHAFVKEEQMMPFIPIVRVKSVEEGIEASHSGRTQLQAHVDHSFARRRAHDGDGARAGHDVVREERPVHGRPGPGRRRLSELLDCHADRRRRDESEDVHAACAAA